jgi:hypothetical protein
MSCSVSPSYRPALAPATRGSLTRSPPRGESFSLDYVPRALAIFPPPLISYQRRTIFAVASLVASLPSPRIASLRRGFPFRSSISPLPILRDEGVGTTQSGLCARRRMVRVLCHAESPILASVSLGYETVSRFTLCKSRSKITGLPSRTTDTLRP